MSKRGDVALEVIPGAPQGRVPDELIPPPDPGEDEPSLREYLDVLVGERRLIAAVVVAATVLGGAYALLATPIYRSDVLVQVEDQKAGTGLLGDLTAAFGDSTPAETEIEILRSRAIVGDVVDELKLDLVARPRRFPRPRRLPRPAPRSGRRRRGRVPRASPRSAGAASGSGSTGSTCRSGSTASRSRSSRARAAGTCSAIRTARRSSRARWARPPPRTAPARSSPSWSRGPAPSSEIVRLRRDAGDRGSPGGPAHLGEGQEDGHPAARARGRRSRPDRRDPRRALARLRPPERRAEERRGGEDARVPRGAAPRAARQPRRRRDGVRGLPLAEGRRGRDARDAGRGRRARSRSRRRSPRSRSSTPRCG